MLLEARITAGYKDNPEVLRDFQLAVEPGEIVGLVGESGSGKSTVALALMRLLEFRGGTARGELLFENRNLMTLPEREMRAVRGRKIAMVLQSPLSALNPAMRIGSQLQEAWRAHSTGGSEAGPDLLELLDTVNLPRDGGGATGREAYRTLQLLETVNLPRDPAFLDRFPRQISVGQAQRILIAMAILHRPALLIADEPTSALDAVTQAEILKLLAVLNRRFGMSILYISHDLLSVASFCHRIAILQHGNIVESASPERLFTQPQHPYSKRLLAAIPQLTFQPDTLSRG
jgi:ABC-type dipeptide/oligopeptide/nickel transport system ATPase component